MKGSRGPFGEYLAFVGLVILVGAILCLLGIWPTRRLAGDGAVLSMLFAVGVAVMGSIVGGAPVVLARARGAVRPQVALVSMLVRLFAVVAFAVVVMLSLELESTPFLLWLAIAYLALLVVDTGYALRLSDSL